jgi:prevent-host-death family protein
MQFVTIRDLRNNSSKILNQLVPAEDLVLTSNGKPVAIISAVTEKNLEQTWKAFRQAKALAALGDIQTASLLNGTSEISEAEIEKEIKAVRKIRKKH